MLEDDWRSALFCRAEMVGRGMSQNSASSAPHEPSLKTTRAAVLAARRGGKAVRERGRRLKRWAREAASQRRFATRTARLCAAVSSPPSACRAGARSRATPRGCAIRADSCVLLIRRARIPRTACRAGGARAGSTRRCCSGGRSMGCMPS